ncbi:hypothetical protein GWK47_045814 [Chionoecetes opilio]|uniref:Uncharacterized protein n=1 Tax=Chionoecetes opilio TaxID=41210 RepID=A0A8J4Y6Y1_CHIOP|nr:hypothetical protein GWK47_045814 [Chionoecetes opilio]
MNSLPANFTLVFSKPLAWDNSTDLKGTLSGAGISHRVKGHCAIPGCRSVPEKGLPEIPKVQEKKHPLTASILPNTILGGGRATRFETAYVAYQRGPGFQSQRTISGFLPNVNHETSPSAFGLGSTSKSQRHCRSRTLKHLPTINPPAKKCPPFNEVLDKSCSCSPYSLTSLCAFYQASMPKRRVLWKQGKFKNIIIGGGLTTICNSFPHREDFSDAGLRDWGWNRCHRRRISVGGEDGRGKKA